MTNPLEVNPLVSAVAAKSFAYDEFRLELSNAPPCPDDRCQQFRPTEMRVTSGRPGSPGRPDRGVEVEVIGPHPSPRMKYERLRRQWSSDSFCEHALSGAPAWVQSLAGSAARAPRRPSGVLSAPQSGTYPVVAILQRADRIVGTEWRIDLADTPDTPGDGVGDFHPTALLVLHSNIGSRGDAMRTTVMLVGTGSNSSGLGKRWDSDALTDRYAFHSMPAWVKELIGRHTGVDLHAEGGPGE